MHWTPAEVLTPVGVFPVRVNQSVADVTDISGHLTPHIAPLSYVNP